MGSNAIEEGYEINIPDFCPDNLEDAIEMLGNVKYASWGFPIFFLFKDQGELIQGRQWSATYRNSARFTNPNIHAGSPLAACKEMHKHLIELKNKGQRI